MRTDEIKKRFKDKKKVIAIVAGVLILCLVCGCTAFNKMSDSKKEGQLIEQKQEQVKKEKKLESEKKELESSMEEELASAKTDEEKAAIKDKYAAKIDKVDNKIQQTQSEINKTEDKIEQVQKPSKPEAKPETSKPSKPSGEASKPSAKPDVKPEASKPSKPSEGTSKPEVKPDQKPQHTHKWEAHTETIYEVKKIPHNKTVVTDEYGNETYFNSRSEAYEYYEELAEKGIASSWADVVVYEEQKIPVEKIIYKCSCGATKAA